MNVRRATAVAIAGSAVLIEGPPGIGKSSLALGLIDRGAVLVGDDAVEIRSEGDRVYACPPANIEGLLEIRNVGLVRFPTCEAPVALVLHLEEDAPRHVNWAQAVEIEGVRVPCLAFYPGGYAAAIRAEHALRVHGLKPPLQAT